MDDSSAPPAKRSMTGAMWWIDRWRKSTAYTDMTAEEQGLYRNLLDEVWLREDHIIPDDPRILARVSGDHEAWQRCGAKVLRWMRRVDGGWSNPVAVEVIQQSQRRADKQQSYRDRMRNAPGNAPGNEVRNEPGSPSPSPSPSPSLGLTDTATDCAPAGAPCPPATAPTTTNGNGATRRTTTSTALVVPAVVSWSSEACDDWARHLGTPPGGRIGSALKPLVGKHGWAVVRPVWQEACERAASEPDPSYFTPQAFARTFVARLLGPQPGRGYGSKSAKAAQELEDINFAIRAGLKGDGTAGPKWGVK